MSAQHPSLANHPEAIDCTLYRSDSANPDAEEIDLGDARLVLLGAFQAPQDWDAAEREAYFDEEDPEQFFIARIECIAAAGSAGHFSIESGDYVAAQLSPEEIVMYYIYEQLEDEHGPYYVLIRDEEEL